MKFCNGTAWHNDSHTFDCDHKEGMSTNILDIVFCCDTTGSMSSYIEKSKSTVKKIIADVMKEGSSEGRTIKFGFVAYKDHPPEDTTYITKCQSLCDESTIKHFINGLSADGGGDGPESVLDGLYVSIHNMCWREKSCRYIFHIADAPPHGRIYTGGSGDNFPEGCPCGIKIENLANSLKDMKIKYKLLKIGSYPNTMAAVFKTNIEDYEELDLDSAIQLEVKVTGILVRDIKSDEQDILLD